MKWSENFSVAGKLAGFWVCMKVAGGGGREREKRERNGSVCVFVK